MHHNICTPLRFKAATTQRIRHQTPGFIMAGTKMKLRKNNQVQSSIKGLSPTRALWNFTDGTQENPWRVWAV